MEDLQLNNGSSYIFGCESIQKCADRVVDMSTLSSDFEVYTETLAAATCVPDSSTKPRHYYENFVLGSYL
jgi:hypothetical protein